MAEQRLVKIFRNGRNQAVRIPKEFELPGSAVRIRRDGPNLVLEPMPEHAFEAAMLEIEAIHREASPDEMTMPDIEELPHTPVDL